MRLDIGSNLGWTIIGVLGIVFYVVLVVVGLPIELEADVELEREKTKQMEIQWKRDSISSLNHTPFN